MSQEKLAEAVGVSFQQIQKYEKGVNRIGTGRLHSIAKLLELPVTYFFEGIDKNPAKTGFDSGMSAITDALSTEEGVRIALALSRIQNSQMRRRIADLLEAMIASEGEDVPDAEQGLTSLAYGRTAPDQQIAARFRLRHYLACQAVAAADRLVDFRFLDQIGALMIWGTLILFVDCIMMILIYERPGEIA